MSWHAFVPILNPTYKPLMGSSLISDIWIQVSLSCARWQLLPVVGEAVNQSDHCRRDVFTKWKMWPLQVHDIANISLRSRCECVGEKMGMSSHFARARSCREVSRRRSLKKNLMVETVNGSLKLLLQLPHQLKKMSQGWSVTSKCLLGAKNNKITHLSTKRLKYEHSVRLNGWSKSEWKFSHIIISYYSCFSTEGSSRQWAQHQRHFRQGKNLRYGWWFRCLEAASHLLTQTRKQTKICTNRKMRSHSSVNTNNRRQKKEKWLQWFKSCHREGDTAVTLSWKKWLKYAYITPRVGAALLLKQTGDEGMRNLPGRQQGDQTRLRMDFQHVKLASLL